MNKFPIIIITGATASGKTSLSLELAQTLHKENIPAEIINFDSLLFYKDLNIGTAKPTADELNTVKHHLIDICTIQEEMNASRFCELALPLVKEMHQNAIIPILVGGSAFYIRALVKGMYEGKSISKETRSLVEKITLEKGYSFIRSELKTNDPLSFNDLHENDEYRNIRAYEFFIQEGRPISEEKMKINDPYDFSDSEHEDWDILHFYLDIPKEDHWPIIEKRTKHMIDAGLIAEVEAILKRSDISGEEKSLQSIGYKETVDHINLLKGDEQASLNDLIEKIYIATRQLAKSQKTFFKKIEPKLKFHPIKDKDIIINKGLEFIRPYTTK
jgi:tRNA dimethylallyltransferase